MYQAEFAVSGCSEFGVIIVPRSFRLPSLYRTTKEEDSVIFVAHRYGTKMREARSEKSCFIARITDLFLVFTAFCFFL